MLWKVISQLVNRSSSKPALRCRFSSSLNLGKFVMYVQSAAHIVEHRKYNGRGVFHVYPPTATQPLGRADHRESVVCALVHMQDLEGLRG